MGFNPITYALVVKELKKARTGISDVSVSEDGKSIVFTETNGNKLSISQSDWETLTLEEREKISKLIITGLGDSILCDDGVYRNYIPKASYNYNDIEGKPSINSVVLEGNKKLEELNFSEVSKTGSYNSLTGLPSIPSKVSDVSNNSAFITRMVNDLVNYYSKASIYTKQESESLISQAKTFSVEIVEELPTNNISSTVIYLMKESGSGSYTQWIYTENTWITIGSTEIDMSKFYTISETDTLVDEKVDKVEDYGLSQENFSPENKDKLETYQEYKPSIISENNLGILKVDGETIVINNGVLSSPSGGGGMEPLNVTGINIESNDKTLIIKWKDPDDRVISGQTVSKWKGTKLVYKADSYPKNESDGILAVDNTIRNQYEDNGFIISGLTNGTTYYFQLFPYSDTMVYNKNEENRFEGVPNRNASYKYMTVKIDTTNSAPAGSVIYEDDAAGMTPKSIEWDEWFGIYPCLLKDGVEVGKLNPNDFNQFEDGSSADIKTGESGDVMICFPRRGLKIANVGDILEIRMTDNPDDPNFSYYAHEKDGTRKDKFYLGVYKAQVKNSVLCSISGVIPTVSQTIDTFRNSAHLKGIGYEQNAFYQTTYRQAMGIMKYKTLNFGFAVGNGVNAGTVPIRTGSADDKGMNYGVTNNINTTVKIFGIEDFFGDIYEYIDGITITSSGDIKTTTDLSKSRGEYPIDSGKYSNAANGYLKKVMGETTNGFIPKEVGASSTTYFSSYVFKAYAYPAIAAYGGNPNEGITPNAYRISFYDPTISSNVRGARLMYL